MSAALDLDALRYDEHGLVACICQDATTGDVLMLAWANREALERTLATGRATFWSRSRGELWEKGATTGNTLEVVELAPTATATRCWCCAVRTARPATRAPRRASARAARFPTRSRARSASAREPTRASPTSRACSAGRASTSRARSARRPSRCCSPRRQRRAGRRGRRPLVPLAGAARARRARSARAARRARARATPLADYPAIGMRACTRVPPALARAIVHVRRARPRARASTRGRRSRRPRRQSDPVVADLELEAAVQRDLHGAAPRLGMARDVADGLDDDAIGMVRSPDEAGPGDFSGESRDNPRGDHAHRGSEPHVGACFALGGRRGRAVRGRADRGRDRPRGRRSRRDDRASRHRARGRSHRALGRGDARSHGALDAERLQPGVPQRALQRGHRERRGRTRRRRGRGGG